VESRRPTIASPLVLAPQMWYVTAPQRLSNLVHTHHVIGAANAAVDLQYRMWYHEQKETQSH